MSLTDFTSMATVAPIHCPMHDRDQEGAERGQHCGESQCSFQAHLRKSDHQKIFV